jgi:hypothetical protein
MAAHKPIVRRYEMTNRENAGEGATASAITWDQLVQAARTSRELLHRLTQDPDAVDTDGLSDDEEKFLELFEAYIDKSLQTHQQVADGLIVALMN